MKISFKRQHNIFSNSPKDEIVHYTYCYVKKKSFFKNNLFYIVSTHYYVRKKMN